MYYLGEKAVRRGFEQRVGVIPDLHWDIIKPFLPIEHMEKGDLKDYLEPTRQSLMAIQILLKEQI